MTRLLTAVLAISLVLAVTHFAPPLLFALLVAGVGTLALNEFLDLSHGWGFDRPSNLCMFGGVLMTLSFYVGLSRTVEAVILILFFLTILCILRGEVGTFAQRVMVGFLGIVYVSGLLGFLILLPRPALFVLFGIIWCGDSAAYYVGRAIGRYKLAPEISPSKTIEGAIAGLLASTVIGVVLGTELLEVSYGWLLWLSIMTGLAAQVGDLVESALKRSAKVKDSGDMLPGHGGVFDRIDSLLFATPVFYFLQSI